MRKSLQNFSQRSRLWIWSLLNVAFLSFLIQLVIFAGWPWDFRQQGPQKFQEMV
jgi:hypothetical protein